MFLNCVNDFWGQINIYLINALILQQFYFLQFLYYEETHSELVPNHPLCIA